MDSSGNEHQHDTPESETPAYPWDDPPQPADAPASGTRHDAFTPARRRVFLKHLVKTGCIADAARLTGVAARTIYRHQEADAEFDRHCDLAIAMAGGGVEQIAWERAVCGVAEQFACGGKVYTRQRYSDALLRLLLQGANPAKYGPRPGFTRKRMRKWERKEIEREIRREIAARQPSIKEVRASIIRKVEAIKRHQEPARLAAGWTRTDEGHWVPPGYVRDPDFVPPQAPDADMGSATPGDSV